MLSRIVRSLTFLWKDEHATTAIEYAVVAALIAAFCVASVQLLGASASQNFEGTAAVLTK